MMRAVKMWIAVVGAACVAGCANGSGRADQSIAARRRDSVGAFELRRAGSARQSVRGQ